MNKKAMYGLVLAVLFMTGCNRSDTNMAEAYWCASYGTCKAGSASTTQSVSFQPSAYQAPQPAVAQNDNCAYYGTCGQQPTRQPIYDACSFYGICDRGS